MTAWVGASFALRFFLATHPAFPAVDLDLHAHRMWTYKEGQVVTNIVGDPSGRGLLVGSWLQGPAVAVDEGEPGPGAAQSPGGAGVGEGQHDQHDGVNVVGVGERVR